MYSYKYLNFYCAWLLYYVFHALKGNKDVRKAKKILSDCYENSNRWSPSENDWPLYRPKHYTPLTLVHHEGRRTESEVITVAQAVSTLGNMKSSTSSQVVDKVHNKAVKDIKDLLTTFEEPKPVPYIILIEGAPGIGKTILSNEIASRWAKHKVLCSKQLLFLLYICDPQLKSIKDIYSLVQYFCVIDDLSQRIAEWLVETSGEHLAIIIDGYDEVSEKNKSHFIFNEIVGRNKLTKCALVITSRPAASAHLHDSVDCRAEVLGFTDENKLDFIESALQGKPDKINELKAFLKSNPSLNALCYIPLNMSILLCLAEEGVDNLPKTQTKLYERFISMTIIHFLKKGKRLPTTNTVAIGLDNLPTPHNQVSKELAQFAFLALQRDQLVFTSEEIKAACPKVTPTNWYGYGLLKPVRYSKCGHEVYSFHFLHLSVQEYLAAHHIATLSYYTLLELLKDTFWNVRYVNTWMMYVGISGGNHFAFRHFLTGNYFLISSVMTSPFISPEIMSNKIKCLHLLRCLGQTDHHMLSTVKNVFQDGVIDLSHQSLSPTDVHTLIALLIQSPNLQWTKLDLSHCALDINSCKSICDKHSLHNAALNIKSVDISGNSDLCWESLKSLSEVLKSWCTEELILSIDSLLDQRTANIVTNFKSKLVQNLNERNFQDERKVFAAIQIVYISEQHKAINVLVTKYYNHYIDIKCSEFSDCQLDDALLHSLSTFINARVDHVECSYIGNQHALNAISVFLNNFKAVKVIGSFFSKGISKIIGSLNSLSPSVQVKLQLYKMQWEVMLADLLAVILCQNVHISSNFLLENTSNDTLIMINVSPCYSSRPFEKYVFRMSECLQLVRRITIINVSINSETAGSIATVLSLTNNLQNLLLNRNNLQTEGVINIAKALNSTSSLVTLNIGDNNIGVEAADDIATILSHNNKLRGLFLHKNKLQTEGMIKIAKALQSTSSLVTLDIGDNNIGVEAADDIATVLYRNHKLQTLAVYKNNLQAEGAIKIAKALQSTSSLITLDIVDNNIGVEAADDIATVLYRNHKLQT